MSLLSKLRKIDNEIIEAKHTVKIGTKSLLMTIRENTDSVNIYIGGHDMYCIHIYIMKEKSIYSSRFDTSIANLPGIEYNQNCSLEYNFKRGNDTNMILKFAITYIHKTYPHVKGISFNDASFRTCDNGKQISLALMSYISTGKTWYEKNFGAYLSSKSLILFESINQRFQSAKTTISWEIMKNIMENQIPMEESKMKTMFESAATWQDFFGPIREVIGISEFCIFVEPWLDNFINETMDYNILGLQYILPVKDHTIVYIISDYQRGGKRFTRSIKKRKGDYR